MREPEDPGPASVCPSCGSAAFDRYCAACGERRLERSDYRVRRFVGEAFEAITEADSRLWQSSRALLFTPGLLSAEYVAGRRRPWIGPVQLFLICNVLFFVVLEFLPVYVFTTRLYDQLHAHPYSGWIMEMEAEPGVTFRELTDDREAFAAYSQTFNTLTAGLAKSLVFMMIPAITLLLWLLHFRRRRFLVEHLTLATHFMAVLLLVVLAGLAVLTLAYRVLPPLGVELPAHSDTLYGPLVLLGLSAWLVPAMRRFYGQSWAWALVKLPVFLQGLILVLFAYRLLLFLMTTRTM